MDRAFASSCVCWPFVKTSGLQMQVWKKIGLKIPECWTAFDGRERHGGERGSVTASCLSARDGQTPHR